MLTKFADVVLLTIVPLFFAIALHEISHGLAAFALGDNTAQKAGRFKLHTHFDLVGSLLLPGILYLLHFPFVIGYAKPVPVNARNFKDPLVDMAIVAIAGPLCNLLLALAMALLLNNINITAAPLCEFCAHFVIANLCLFFLNLIPIPPLDGSRVAAALMPEKFVGTYYALEPFGFFIIIAIEMFLRQLSTLVGSNISLFHFAIDVPMRGILNMLFA
ncbi:MAG: site-2 protease family protein [Holosporaceae bacterium]|jgi:Zn-dependent protease|nr:site-2 protease family protein [Holosporaceae bacterium]